MHRACTQRRLRIDKTLDAGLTATIRCMRRLPYNDHLSPVDIRFNYASEARTRTPAVRLLLHLSVACRAFIDCHLPRFVRNACVRGRAIHHSPNRPFSRETRFTLQQQQPASLNSYVLNSRASARYYAAAAQ